MNPNKTQELQEQNKLADALIAKLEKIKALYAELPSEDQLDDLDKKVGSIASSLETIAETYQADDFPVADEFYDLDKLVSGIARSMEQIAEIYNADDFPNADQFDDLDKKLGGIVGSLNEIVEQQEEVAQ